MHSRSVSLLTGMDLLFTVIHVFLKKLLLLLTDYCKGFRTYYCKTDRMCIWYEQMCDGKVDCPTGEDEDDSCVANKERGIADSNSLL